MADSQVVTYRAEHTPQKFHMSSTFVRGLMGPVGSGKSVACTCEIMNKMMTQNVYNGVRRSRWAVIRNTYGELRTTTLNTFKDWFPASIVKINMQPPITAKVNFAVGDGTRVEGEVLFLALDRADDSKKLLSLELTGGWINEAREVPKAVLDMLTTRVRRYPSKAMGGSAWNGVIMDTNPPDDDHWWYQLAEVEKPQNHEFWKQPGAMIKHENGKDVWYEPNPAAENINNLDGGFQYYQDIVPGKSPEYVKVMVMGQYGTVYDGRPVYPEFNEALHCVDDLEPMRGRALILGFDFGLTPACVFVQQTPRGALLVLDELYVEDMGMRQFLESIVLPHIQENYFHMPVVAYGDPAGAQRAQTDERSCFEIMAECGLPCEPAPSNKMETRKDAVSYYLNRLADGEAGFRISPKCNILRKGFNGGYRYRRVKMPGTHEERYKDQPEKNRMSHPHDALQYAALSIKELGGYANEGRTKPREIKTLSAKGWT
jgi:hypothetical protein